MDLKTHQLVEMGAPEDGALLGRLVAAEDKVPDFIRDNVSWGAGPRAGQYLILGGKARAVLHGRFHVSTDDIAAVARPVLRHRIVTNFNADAEGITPDKLVDQLISTIPAKSGAVIENRETARLLKV